MKRITLNPQTKKPSVTVIAWTLENSFIVGDETTGLFFETTVVVHEDDEAANDDSKNGFPFVEFVPCVEDICKALDFSYSRKDKIRLVMTYKKVNNVRITVFLKPHNDDVENYIIDNASDLMHGFMPNFSNAVDNSDVSSSPTMVLEFNT